MTGKDLPSLDDVVAAAMRGEQYKIKRHADGSLELEADGEEDHRLMKDALEQIGLIDHAQLLRDLSEAKARMAAASAAAAPAPTANPHPKIPAIAVGKAASQWLAEIKSASRPKTHKIKTTAVEGFAKHYGEKNPLKDAGRIDVGNWIQALRAGGLQTPTIVNGQLSPRFLRLGEGSGLLPAFRQGRQPRSRADRLRDAREARQARQARVRVQGVYR